MGYRSGGTIEQLIDKIYAAVEDPRRWGAYLEALADAVGARMAMVVMRQRANDRAELVAGHNIDQAIVEEFLVRRDTPLWLLARRSLEAGTVSQDNVVSSHSRMIDELRRLRPSHALVFSRDMGDNVEGNLFLLRTEGDPPFPAEAERLLNDLMPHIYRARNLARMIRTGEDSARAARAVLDQLSTGVVIFDEANRALVANVAAEALFAQEDGLTLRQSALHATSSADTQALRAAIAEAANGGGPQAMPIPRRSLDRHYAVLVIPLRGADGNRFGVRPAAAVIVADPDGGNFLSPDMLEALYGLTPAEARLVTGLAAGKRLNEIANDTGVSKNTLRTQLNRAFEKTGTNRQAELIRLVLSGAALLKHDEPDRSA